MAVGLLDFSARPVDHMEGGHNIIQISRKKAILMASTRVE